MSVLLSNLGEDVSCNSGRESVEIAFVTQDLFVRLQSANFKLDEFIKAVKLSQTPSMMSTMTHAYLSHLNKKLSKLVLGKQWLYPGPAITERERKYIKDAVKADMVQECPTEQSQLCYDTVPVDGNKLLVVVHKGFLNHIAGSKDNYEQFVLACIRCMDRFNCDLSRLNHLYLLLKFVGATHELLRCSIQ